MAGDQQPSNGQNPLLRLARWVGTWPVVQELIAFGHDVARHYKLDRAAAEATLVGKGIKADYSRSSSRLRFWFLLTLFATIALLVCAAGYQVWTNPDYSRPLHLPMPVEAFRVRVMDLTDVSGGGGQVQPSQIINLTSWIMGQVTKVPVNLGDIVGPDTILYECDPAPLDAALTAAQEKVNMLQSTEKITEKQDAGTQEMKKEGLASEADVLTSAGNLAQARSNLASAQQALIQAQIDRQSAQVKSPVSGIVMGRMLNPGERVIVNQQVMTLGDLKDIYFLASISEDKIASVSTGLHAEVVFESFPSQVFQGDVFFVDPKTDPQTRSFKAYVKIPNPGLKLKPGLSGFARITQQKHVLVVPDAAVMNPVGQNATVFIITPDNHAVLRQVRYGTITQGWAEIDEGLQEGDLVAAVGPLYLKDGDKIHYHLERP